MLAKVEAVGDGGEVRFGSKAEGGGLPDTVLCRVVRLQFRLQNFLHPPEPDQRVGRASFCSILF
jgi:hypothetical protein